ncbi:hypothetical protein AVO42_04975 [Thiomicrospira sp. XS5]|jgi:hypothetical protein|uniref:hypothetical protein n=1 Tax=Thiomicrospira sp. XS5 TaxID=1775636 RepID=UPI0007474EAC|nr:hypothetical protein [Thiomicrospira sp. XS5]KUJ74745.1 hypothetical protein AVO42_04975 [Thiomicrospira sp. XS5]
MPYQVTSIRDNYRYTAIVPRRELAYTIIKFLADLGLTLNEFKQVVHDSELSPAHILDEAAYLELVEIHPEMDLIYESLCLKNNERMYFHTNWTVSSLNWQKMTLALAAYRIEVTTIKSRDISHSLKTKTPLSDAERAQLGT